MLRWDRMGYARLEMTGMLIGMPDAPDADRLKRLAAAVRQARGAAGLSIRRAAELGAMSKVTWSNVEAERPVTPLSYAGVERALGWEPGSVEAVLGGGEPLKPPGTAGGVSSGLSGSADELDLIYHDPDMSVAEKLKRFRQILDLRRQAAEEADAEPDTDSRSA